MAVVNSACVRSVIGQGFGARNVNSALPERISSGKFCSSSGVGRLTSLKSNVRCSSLPGDHVAPGKSFGKSSSSKNLRWVEEDVSVAGGVEGNLRNISVVQALSEDVEGVSGSPVGTELLAELLVNDRPHPIAGGYGVTPQMGMEMIAAAMRGDDVQAMAASLYRPKLVWFAKSEEEEKIYLDRAFNATLAGAAISYAAVSYLTVDHDVWHGWTMFEVLKYAPLHNWHAYEEFLGRNPVLAKMMISGVVYSIGDWIGQCVEGKPVLDFSRVRLLRSGLVGFCLHGSLSHYYYHVCEFLFPFQGWWAVPLKVAFDQTVWSAIWNSIYFVALGLLRFESPARIWKDLRETFFPLLTAGWKLWPFAHLVTYGLVPLEQRLLWVDCVEIVWVTILSMFANEKAEKRLEAGENEIVLVLSSDRVEEIQPSEESKEN